MSDSESSRLAFEDAMSIISEDYKQLPDADELIAKITRKFTELYNDPHVSDLKKAVGDVNIDDARSLLFNPSVVQRRLYPIMLRKESGLPSHLRLSVLSLVYTLHRKKWSFLRDFVLADGLDVLVRLLVEPNLYARGQVCEIILSVIDSDQERFDWFVPFKAETDCSTVRGHLYRKLAGVYSAALLDQLVANSVNYSGGTVGEENSFPGGSARCLQIMAFWLSWMRVQFTPDQKLQLSGALLAHLKEWAEVAARTAEEAKKNEPAYKKQTESNEGSDEQAEEEQEDGEAKLARTLAEDFGAAGEATVNVMESDSGDFSDYFIALFVLPEAFMTVDKHLGQDEHLALLEKEKASTEPENIPIPKPAAQTAPSSSGQKLSSISAQQLKDMGNEKFFANKYTIALGFYSIGIEKLQGDMSNPDNASSDNTTRNASLLASLHYNCASCYWKLAATDSAQIPKLMAQYTTCDVLKKYTTSEHLQVIADDMRDVCASKDALYAACMANCEKCLVEAPSHRRALHRQASCLLAQERYSEALALVEEGLARAPAKAAQSTAGLSKQKKQEAESAVEEIKALHDLRRLCLAHMMMGKDGAKESSAKSSSVSSSKDTLVNDSVSLILGKLKARQAREQQHISHAWDGVERTGDESTESGTTHDPSATASSSTATLEHGQSTASTAETVTKTKQSKKMQKEKLQKKAEEDAIVFQKKCMKHNKALRKLAGDYITAGRRSLEELDDGSSEYKEWMTSFNKAFKSVWKAGYTLAQVFEVKSLDEDMLFAVSVLLADHSGSAATATKEKALVEIKACSGFQRVVNFLFMDDAVRLRMSVQGAKSWTELYLS